MITSDFNSSHKPTKTGETFEPSADFPFDEVFKRLDGEAEAGLSDAKTDMAEMVETLRAVFVWMTKAKARDQRAIKSVGIKAIAAAWVVNPELFDNAPAHMVAKSRGISPQILKTKTADFSRTFKIQNRFQVHDWQNQRRAIL